jgi:hypothetical protein
MISLSDTLKSDVKIKHKSCSRAIPYRHTGGREDKAQGDFNLGSGFTLRSIYPREIAPGSYWIRE